MRISRGKKSALILLSPKVGNYSVVLGGDFTLVEGNRANFSCPVCQADLQSPVNSQFGEVLRERPEGGYDRVEFHRTYGKRATFVVAQDEVRAFGEDAESFRATNFFGAGGSEK
jgi:hypothetical protein